MLVLLTATWRFAQAPTSALESSVASFVDIAEKAGLTMTNVFGGVDTKKYIIETTGTGVAIFDYDNDGWPDIFFVNGTTLEDMKAGKSGPTNHLYHNNHDGTFTDVTEKAGLAGRHRLGARRLRRATTTTTGGRTCTSRITGRTGCTTTSMASLSW